MKNELLDVIEDDSYEVLSDVQILQLLITQPKKVARFLVAVKYDKFVPLLITLPPVLNIIGIAVFGSHSEFVTLFLRLFLGVLFSWIVWYLVAILVRWSGSFFGGKADYYSVLIVIIYAALPNTLFQISEPFLMYNFPRFAIYIWGISLMINVLSIVLTVSMVAEAHKISNGLSFLSLVIAGLFIIVPITGIVFLGLWSYLV